MSNNLEKRTLTYWQVSKSFHGRASKKISTQQALRRLTNVAQITRPDKPLSKPSIDLIDDIIRGRKAKKRPVEIPTPVTQLRDRKVNNV